DIQVYKAHAINVADFTEVEGWPVTIRGNFMGRPFEAYRHIQRSPLNLMELKDGKKFLYVTFAARCDAFDCHGWVFGIAVDAPQKGVQYAFNTTPDGNGGGIWGPGGISIDPDRKHGYIAAGNGTTNWMTGGNSYAMSVLRLDLTNREQPFSRAAED